ncbi:hypothetical protein [Sphingomonas crusticola]|uniref:hypothetical protein n=1 Tax=Sphingomonas crusticola TaxID=1697973 RepID=UPI000E27BD89|nr:hypothetical protein [Sphingomonas crusticola]
MIDALPPPEILAGLNGPATRCVISYQYTYPEAGDVTSARCGNRRYLIARDYHGDSVRRLNGCAVMVMTEGVRFPRLFHVDNCRGPLQAREVGKVWTRELLAAGRIAPARLDRVIYYPLAGRPACYRVSIAFTPPGKRTNTPLDERSAMRCDGGAGLAS